MDRIEAFQILGLEAVKDERAIRNAYREKLAITNPEDDPEGFKRLRGAYEEASRYAKEPDEAAEEEKPRDMTVSGLWLEKAVEIYGNIRTRQDVELWEELFDDDAFLSLEEEENCRLKLLSFMTEHYKLPTQVWKLLDKKLGIRGDAKNLREKFPANFVHYIVSKCERGEDLVFDQFEGDENADYDLFLEYYDRCWQALHDGRTDEAKVCLGSADKLGIRHPVMEVCRANLLLKEGQREEAIAILEGQLDKYPKDTMLSYNFAEMLWSLEEENSEACRENGKYKQRAAQLYRELKAENNTHYMANMRLTKWYYDEGKYREAKKCAEKVLAHGSDDAFMELLVKINQELEKELEERYRRTGGWEPALELCWCYLQDGKIAAGLMLAMKLEKLLPSQKEAEYHGLLAKLYVEQAEYEKSIAMTRQWEISLKAKMERNQDEGEEVKKDHDRLRQTHLIRMQCYHNLGFADEKNFELAVEEGKSVLGGELVCSGTKDIGIFLELAQIYIEMEEYEKSLEVARMLVEEHQVFAAYAASLEAYRRQLSASGVVQSASQCIRYFPSFVKSYEYMAKVYLDLDRREDLAKVLEDAGKNGVKSVILEGYRFQMTHKAMEVSVLNGKLRSFRKNYLEPAEHGEKDSYEKGLPILTEYIYHYPDDFMLVERAIFHRAAHHYQEAREDFEKALYMNPSNPYALNGLSFVYKYLGEYDKALFFIKKAILYLDKEMSPVIYADMGNLYALLGDFEMALKAYGQYEGMSGESISNWFWDNLAEFHMKTGHTEEAARVYENFYKIDQYKRYEKLVNLYGITGQREEARRFLRRWRSEMSRTVCSALVRLYAPETVRKQMVFSYAAYNYSRGWMELMLGSKRAAVRAFGKIFWNGLAENTMEDKICDAVFTCILCGEEKRGRRYARRLWVWLEREKMLSRPKYYNQEKAHLLLEFLAFYYTERTEKLQEILEREDTTPICHSCICPLCGKLEAAKVIFLLRMGRREEAKERLRRNLEVQPKDKYLLTIKHITFSDIL